MTVSSILQKLFREIVAEAEHNAAFAERIRDAFGPVAKSSRDRPRQSGRSGGAATKRPTRRAPGPFDPFLVGRSEGVPALRSKLEALTVGQLKDIVAEHAMDPSRLALRWKVPRRLIELIVATVVARSSKGDAFRESPVGFRQRRSD
jgi:hypothetical protein